MVEKNDIERCFSEELNWIRDEILRDQVVCLWKILMMLLLPF
jgi:hypothetical protein